MLNFSYSRRRISAQDGADLSCFVDTFGTAIIKTYTVQFLIIIKKIINIFGAKTAIGLLHGRDAAMNRLLQGKMTRKSRYNGYIRKS